MKSPSVLALVACLCAPAAVAAEAECFTTDDGRYPCAFEQLDEGGSFRISADGKPTFELWISGPGEAYGIATFEAGGRGVNLPGSYVRSEDDPGCWDNTSTKTRLCAW